MPSPHTPPHNIPHTLSSAPPASLSARVRQATPAKADILRSTLVSRNVTVAGKRTSVRLEPEMWDGLQEICRRERANMHQICTAVNGQKRAATSLTAAIRVSIMRYFRQAATEDGHNKAGHGYGMAIGINPTRLQSTHNPPPLRATGMAAFHKTSFA